MKSKQAENYLKGLETQRDALVDANDTMRKERDEAVKRANALDEETGNLKQDKELAEVAAADFKLLATQANDALADVNKMLFDLLKVEGIRDTRDAIILLKTSRDVNRDQLTRANESNFLLYNEREKLKNQYSGVRILCGALFLIEVLTLIGFALSRH